MSPPGTVLAVPRDRRSRLVWDDDPFPKLVLAQIHRVELSVARVKLPQLRAARHDHHVVTHDEPDSRRYATPMRASARSGSRRSISVTDRPRPFISMSGIELPTKAVPMLVKGSAPRPGGWCGSVAGCATPREGACKLRGARVGHDHVRQLRPPHARQRGRGGGSPRRLSRTDRNARASGATRVVSAASPSAASSRRSSSDSLEADGIRGGEPLPPSHCVGRRGGSSASPGAQPSRAVAEAQRPLPLRRLRPQLERGEVAEAGQRPLALDPEHRPGLVQRGTCGTRGSPLIPSVPGHSQTTASQACLTMPPC